MVWIGGSFLFEVLDYGADISGGVEVGSGFSRRFYVIYAGNFINLVVRSLFGVCKELQVCFSQVFCSWEGAEFLEVVVGWLPEVDSAYLPVVYRYFHFG
jgi:hypothetical protein